MITLWTRGEIIGAIGLMGFTREHSRAKTGSWIGRPVLEPGICCRGGLCGAGLRVPGDGSPPDLCLLPHPQQSHRGVMDTGGMRHEGVLRQRIQKNGNFQDVVVPGLLREEYLSGG